MTAAAFRDIYDSLVTPIFNYVCKIVSREDAEEITADAFVKLWNEPGEFKKPEQIRGYLFKVTRNSAVDRIRRMHDIFQVEAGDEPDTYTDIIKSQLYLLPDMMRRVILLRLDGYEYPAISLMLHNSERTVRNLYARAVRKIKDKIKK